MTHLQVVCIAIGSTETEDEVSLNMVMNSVGQTQRQVCGGKVRWRDRERDIYQDTKKREERGERRLSQAPAWGTYVAIFPNPPPLSLFHVDCSV